MALAVDEVLSTAKTKIQSEDATQISPPPPPPPPEANMLVPFQTWIMSLVKKDPLIHAVSNIQRPQQLSISRHCTVQHEGTQLKRACLAFDRTTTEQGPGDGTTCQCTTSLKHGNVVGNVEWYRDGIGYWPSIGPYTMHPLASLREEHMLYLEIELKEGAQKPSVRVDILLSIRLCPYGHD